MCVQKKMELSIAVQRAEHCCSFVFSWRGRYTIDTLKKKEKRKKTLKTKAPPNLLWCKDPPCPAHVSFPGLGEKRLRDLLSLSFF